MSVLLEASGILWAEVPMLRLLPLSLLLCACEPGSAPIDPDPSGNPTTGAGGAPATTATGGTPSTTGVGGTGATGGDATGTGAGGDTTSAGGNATGGSMSLPEGQAGYVSGARLKARFYEVDDGAKQFVGWYDSLLDIDCSFFETSLGLRCLPPTTAVTLANYYLDSLCTQPLGISGTMCVLPSTQTVTINSLVGCSLVAKAYEATPIPTPSTVYYSLGVGNPCTSQAGSTAFVYYLLADQSLAPYASATEQHE